jgi:Lactonase, 7-bladed beta-propeller
MCSIPATRHLSDSASVTPGWSRCPVRVRRLASKSGPAQVGFTPDGPRLVVTDRGTDSIAFYAVDAHGGLGTPEVQPSSGPTPYGFAFASDGTLRGLRDREGQGGGLLIPHQGSSHRGLRDEALSGDGNFLYAIDADACRSSAGPWAMGVC